MEIYQIKLVSPTGQKCVEVKEGTSVENFLEDNKLSGEVSTSEGKQLELTDKIPKTNELYLTTAVIGGQYQQ